MDPVQFYKALADETRLRCLLLIEREAELCVCELMAALQESQPKISRHLALLREQGVLSDRRQGQWVFYRINPELPAWARQVLAISQQHNANFLQGDQQRLQHMGERPERVAQCC